jgi:hypothetical protein
MSNHEINKANGKLVALVIVEFLVFSIIAYCKIVAADRSVLAMAGYSYQFLIPLFLLNTIACIIIFFTSLFSWPQTPETMRKRVFMTKALYGLLLLLLLIMPPYDWHTYITTSGQEATEEEKLDQFALYEQFVEDWDIKYSLDELTVFFLDNSVTIPCILSDTLRDEIADILSDMPLEYYYHPKGEPQPRCEKILGIWIFPHEVYESHEMTIDYNVPSYYIENTTSFENTTIIRLDIPDHENMYFTTENANVEPLFELLYDSIETSEEQSSTNPIK